MGHKKNGLVWVLIFFYGNTIAQTKDVSSQSLYWLRYYNQISLNNKWTWHNEIDERRFFENNRQQQLIMHTRFHYKWFKNADIALGFTYSLQSSNDPNSTSQLVIPELRPVLELNSNSDLTKKISIQQRCRIDNRFIRTHNGIELLDGYNYTIRFRYRLQLSYQLITDPKKLASTLKFHNEIMLHAGKQIVYKHFDQNRMYAGFEQGIHKNLSIELGYLHWYQQRVSGNQFFNRDIFRLTIYHKIKL